MAKKVKVTLVRSTIGHKINQRATVKALGLRKLNSSVIVELNPAIEGMIKTVSHLVKTEESK